MGNRGGARPGAGKPRGPTKATIERDLLLAKVAMEQAVGEPGRKLARQVLDDIMHACYGLMAKHQPLEPNEVATGGRTPDDDKFVTFLRLTKETAEALAPYQSPKFKSVTLTVERPPGGEAQQPGERGHLKRMSGQEAYRMLRESSELIELKAVKQKAPPALKVVKGKRGA